MKKLFTVTILLVIAAYLGLLPFHSTEISELLPVQTVFITASGKEYTVDIGAGVKAVGATLSDALENLKERVTGEVFFQTADQVVANDAAVLSQAAEEQAFRPAAKVYLTDMEDADIEKLSDYLSTHEGSTTLSDLRAVQEKPVQLQKVSSSEGGYVLTR